MLDSEKIILVCVIIFALGCFGASIGYAMKMKNAKEENDEKNYRDMSLVLFGGGILLSFFLCALVYSNAEEFDKMDMFYSRSNNGTLELSTESGEYSSESSISSSVKSSDLASGTDKRSENFRQNMSDNSNTSVMNTSKHLRGLDMGLFMHEQRLKNLEEKAGFFEKLNTERAILNNQSFSSSSDSFSSTEKGLSTLNHQTEHLEYRTW